MLYHHIKLFFRNLMRSKGFTAINILGLSAGMAVSILILLYVYHEISYDRFIPEGKQKYRLVTQFWWAESFFEAPRSNGELGSMAVEQIPEVQQQVTISEMQPYVACGDKLFREQADDAVYAGGDVFDFFGIEMLQGDPAHVFDDPASVVLSESKARKYFDDEDPLGKILILNPQERPAGSSSGNDTDRDKDIEVKVTGIFRDYPVTAHQQFGMIFPMSLYLKMNNITNLRDQGNSYTTYLRLRKGAGTKAVQDKLAEITLSLIPEKLRTSISIKVGHVLQPIRRIHLYSNFAGFNENTTGGRIVYVYVFSAIAVFILLLAAINFMNLSTARYTARAREVALRKVNGASRRVLIGQFLGESVTISLISLFTALVLAELLLPVFNSLTGTDLSFNYLARPKLFLGFLALGLLTGLISGSYPAFFLSRFRPLDILRGRIVKNRSGKHLRWSLVIFQFSIALVLASSTLIVYRQLHFVKTKSLGFDKEHVLMFTLRGENIRHNMEAFKHKLAQIPGVQNYTFSLDRPGIRTSWYNNYTFEDNPQTDHPAFASVSVDENFFDTFGMKLMEGRNFSPDRASDTAAVIINQTMVKYLGWDDPVGKTIYGLKENFDREPFRVIGVLRDFHMESLHKSIAPLIFKYKRQQPRWGFVRIRPGDPSQTISRLEAAWNDISPSRKVSLYFLDEAYDSEYRSERQFGRIFIYFTLFALFIAGLGVVGLVSFITASRTKEIGIRKVMGASTATILQLLSMDYIKMIGIALVISVPVSYFIMEKWLERFAYTTPVSVLTFILAGMIALLVALLSTTVQTVRAARQNPADSIRYE